MIRPICDQVRPACLPQSILRRPSTLLNAILYNHPLQAHFSLLHPGKVNGEYQPLFKKFGYGTTIWSPLESGQLSGKYVDGVPKGSRYDTNPEFFKETVAKLNSCAPSARAVWCTDPC
jgi:aryl-alcohol dehydrogenase-like predicted oxidoreductase